MILMSRIVEMARRNGLFDGITIEARNEVKIRMQWSSIDMPNGRSLPKNCCLNIQIILFNIRRVGIPVDEIEKRTQVKFV